MIVLSPGKKIKKFRTELSLNQDDLANELVTRSLISMIENEKRNLTYETANIIAASLNQFYAPLGKVITPEYLLETEQEQIARYIQEELEKLEPLIEKRNAVEEQVEDRFKGLVELAEKESLDKLYIQAQNKLARYYYAHYRYKEALSCFNNVLEYELSYNTENIAALYNEIGKCHSMLMYLETAIVYYTRAYELSVQKRDMGLRPHILYNLLLVYYKQRNYNKALALSREFKEHFWNTEATYLTHHLTLVESSIYREIGNLDRAEKGLLGLLSKKHRLSIDTVALVYANLSILHRRREEYDRCHEALENALSLQEQIDRDHLLNILFQYIEYYICLKQYDDALDLLERVYTLSCDLSFSEGIADTFIVSGRIYMSLSNWSMAEDSFKKAEKVILGESDVSKDRKCLIYTYYIELYSQINHVDKCKAYLELLRKQYDISGKGIK